MIKVGKKTCLFQLILEKSNTTNKINSDASSLQESPVASVEADNKKIIFVKKKIDGAALCNLFSKVSSEHFKPKRSSHCKALCSDFGGQTSTDPDATASLLKQVFRLRDLPVSNNTRVHLEELITINIFTLIHILITWQLKYNTQYIKAVYLS